MARHVLQRISPDQQLLSVLWRDRRIGGAVATVLALLLGLAIAQTMPRGPLQPMAVSLKPTRTICSVNITFAIRAMAALPITMSLTNTWLCSRTSLAVGCGRRSTFSMA